MKHALAILGPILGIALIADGAPALAGVNGRVDTLERGAYACEMPGDAASRRGVPVPEEGFTITNGSAYAADGKNGTYLRVGDIVTMTSGPRKGSRYALKNERHLKKLAQDGNPTGLRCVKLGSPGA